ncbi:MAG: DUF3375 domain-containing protein [Selenomonas sp.]|uniref:DUF3375 domain-containing protein n=1 Tax=Selenomonas sp. TaxID=2053611 RepID=UPI0025E159DA|nr:DUF3375 domain-containing protein [Selenomonas sp.]MCI6232074.1 DUF3375 domain-containing protein [Selenomonas sp.]
MAAGNETQEMAPASMAAQFVRLTALRQESAAWRLLASPQAPFVAAFFAREFLVPGRRRVAEAELLRGLEDAMQEAAQAKMDTEAAGEGLIRPAREYLLMWSDEAHGWLRRFHGADDAPCYDLTAAAEHAVRFAAGLSHHGFLGTESRLRTVVHLLGEIAEDRDEDAAHRERILLEKRQAIDEELAELHRTGKVQPKLTAGQVRERYQQARETAESILEDFRALEEAFGALGRGLMHDIVTWQEGKGELLAKVFERGDVIRESEEGRSFALFWRFLMAGDRQAELDALLAAVSQVPELKEFAAQGGGLSGLLREWVAGAAAVQQTMEQLSRQLRRYVDERSMREERVIYQLIAGIERTASDVRKRPPRGDFAAIDLPHADISLPMDRKIFQPPQRTRLKARTLEAGEAAEAQHMADGGKALAKALEVAAVDRKVLQKNIEETAKEHGESDVTLAEVVKRHPLTEGLSELLAYFVLAEGQEYGDAAEEMRISFEKDNRKRVAVMNEIRFPVDRK